MTTKVKEISEPEEEPEEVFDETEIENEITGDEFLDGIRPNQYIRKAELCEAGSFNVVSVHKQVSRQYNRDEHVLSVALVDDDSDTLRMISFGVGNTYIDAFVKRWQKYKIEGKEPGLFVLREVERNRFRFCRPE